MESDLPEADGWDRQPEADGRGKDRAKIDKGKDRTRSVEKVTG